MAVITERDPLLALDVYKMGHMVQYAPGTTQVYVHLIARYDREYTHTVFFGLQYYLHAYLSTPLEPWMAEEFIEDAEEILGKSVVSDDMRKKIRSLAKLGYFPIKIKAVPEGTVMPTGHVLMTIVNTHPDFYWVPGFIESLIIKIQSTITTASVDYKYKTLINRVFDETVDDEKMFLREFVVHDFGYRSDSSEETAQLHGASCLVNFKGSDTVPALRFIKRYYGGNPKDYLIMASVPASEHSVMCSFERENEFAAFEHMFDLYPTGPVSIVSDTFDVYCVLTEFAERLKVRIMTRDGKAVFRPDSGNPEFIITGDPNYPADTPQGKGAIRLLDEKFGSYVNKKGYKYLDPHVGLIYGDAMYYERLNRILLKLKQMGYAASELFEGIGGIRRMHSRDTMGFAIKATHIIKNGTHIDIEKDPVTDHSKKSFKGLLSLTKNDQGEYVTLTQCTEKQESEGLLVPVFENGKVLLHYSFKSIRDQTSRSYS